MDRDGNPVFVWRRVYFEELSADTLLQADALFGVQIIWDYPIDGNVHVEHATRSHPNCDEVPQLSVKGRARGACVGGVLAHRRRYQLFRYGVLMRSDGTTVCKLRALCCHPNCCRWTPYVDMEPNIADAVTALVMAKLASESDSEDDDDDE
jgi:hypothetical protein